MGMAVMLDEIINYVQSLQNQVEVSSSNYTYKRRTKGIETKCSFFFFLFNFSSCL